MTEKEWVRLGGKDGVCLAIGAYYAIDDGVGQVGKFGLGGMPWPTIELRDGKLYVNGEERGKNDEEMPA